MEKISTHIQMKQNFSYVTRREVYQLEFSNVWDIKSRKNLKELFNFFFKCFFNR